MPNDNIRELIIIGSGPAGYTAAIYAARADLRPLVLAGPEPGGQLTTTTLVENYPGFPDGIDGPVLIENMRKQAERFGAEIKFDTAAKVDFSGEIKKVYVGNTQYSAKAVIIATGARSRTLGLPREKDLWGRGLHTCATCDGFFYRGKTVAVAGGGDSAMEESGFLTKFADKIYIIHRRAEFKASEIMKKRILANKKIAVIWNSEVEEYLGQEKLNGLKIKNAVTGETSTLAVDGLFFAIGHVPNTEIFKDYLEREPKFGYLAVKEAVYTNVAGVFAAGDCADYTYRQAVTAAGLGGMAAIAAERWLEKLSF